MTTPDGCNNTVNKCDDILFRWAVGDQENALEFARLSILSLFRYLPNSQYFLLYNGDDFSKFSSRIKDIPELQFVNLIDQNQIKSPFHFAPNKKTAWWKWIPLHLNKSNIECIVDIDIIFVRKPTSIIQWISSPSNMIAAEDKFNITKSFNTGNFSRQIKTENMINVGFLGVKDNIFKNLFLKKTEQICYGETKSSLHIDEQGAANVAVQIGERAEKLNVTRVPMNTFIWFNRNLNMQNAESIHFIAETKDSLNRYYSFWNHLIKNDIENYKHEILELVDDSYQKWITPDVYRKICFARQIPKSNPTTSGDLY